MSPVRSASYRHHVRIFTRQHVPGQVDRVLSIIQHQVAVVLIERQRAGLAPLLPEFMNCRAASRR